MAATSIGTGITKIETEVIKPLITSLGTRQRNRDMQKVMISCFDYTTTMAKPWADAGYLCYCVDMQHPAGETRTGNIVKVGANMLEWLPPRGEIAFAAFFPPCTDVAVSGARWFRDKGLGRLITALTLFKRSVDIAELIGAPYMLENPVSTVSSYWRKPDYSFGPCDYGDPYTKKTCLWTGNGFVMPPKNRVEPIEGSKMRLLPPSAERANLRSATPEGFAQAVLRQTGWSTALILTRIRHSPFVCKTTLRRLTLEA